MKYLGIILIFGYLISRCLTIQTLKAEHELTSRMFVFWPNATIPFYINPDHFDHEQQMTIMTALSMFAFKTCLKFAPVMAAPDENQHVLSFVNPDGIRRCKIYTKGHSNYHPHIVWLGYDCLKSPEIEMIIMRALGFYFEHNRKNRDIYIDVMLPNVEPSFVDLFTKDDMLPTDLRGLQYDVNSVMHFGERDYSKNGHRTIMFKNPKVHQNRVGLSQTDIIKIEIVYGPECRARDRREKIELCQSYPGVARRKREVKIVDESEHKSLRVNRDITPPHSIINDTTNATEGEEVALSEDFDDSDDTEYIEANLKALGLANETEQIVTLIYKVSATAFKHAREKHCNGTENNTIVHEYIYNKQKRNNSDIFAVLEVIADHAKSMIDNAMKNITVFCQSTDALEMIQRQKKCNWANGDRCPKTYRSTKSGPVKHSTQHRPVYKQPTKHQGAANKYSYDRNRRLGDDQDGTTPIAKSRRKREVTTAKTTISPIKEKKPTKEKKILKEKMKKEKMEVQKDNTTVKLKKTTGKPKKEQPPRRFFQQKRYRKHNTQETSDWHDESNISLDKEKSKEGEDTKKSQDDDQEQEIDKEEELQKEKEVEIEAAKVIDKEELVKEVLNEGLDTILEGNIGKSDEKTADESKEETKTSDTEKDEKSVESDKPTIKEKTDSDTQLSIDVEKSSEEKSTETEIETTTQRRKRKKIKADKQVLEEDIQNYEEQEKRPKKANMQKRKRSRGGMPKIVKLNKLNKEFYNERKWPDGIVRYVIKKIPDFDLEDLRNRLAEVNSILTARTCVKLVEVDSKEAPGYEDYLVLDTSPDYVTGRVGGKQIFGCVELFRGGQHRQHTAMMVMAMLGFYFEVSRHDRDRHIRVHMRHVRPDKLHHFEKIREEATLDVPYDYKSATHPAWQFWRKIGKTGISTVATYKEQDPDGSVMRSLGQNPELLSETDILKINSIYGVECFQGDKRASIKKKHRDSIETLAK